MVHFYNCFDAGEFFLSNKQLNVTLCKTITQQNERQHLDMHMSSRSSEARSQTAVGISGHLTLLYFTKHDLECR